jgi:hypothetical protein
MLEEDYFLTMDVLPIPPTFEERPEVEQLSPEELAVLEKRPADVTVAEPPKQEEE